MDDSLVCNGFKNIFLYIYNQTIMHPLVTHTIMVQNSKQRLRELEKSLKSDRQMKPFS
ncbi:hypothetical protein RHMOL_Rhmol13G0119600 [Rhododendron molle]|uniref:Uncharacterized protein n=1 Tax=Rhododendron molle TaxID=49168 RepID=A0ACC0L6S1_RHOML|nr:hypothetical protein RHMOL_Rhmol13G0119600 [Rhododendron molle]